MSPGQTGKPVRCHYCFAPIATPAQATQPDAYLDCQNCGNRDLYDTASPTPERRSLAALWSKLSGKIASSRRIDARA